MSDCEKYSLPKSSAFVGMDEAGFGPNLGPLVLAVTRWHLPGDPEGFDFYSELAPIVSRTGHAQGKQLHIADSKQVFVGKFGFESLECSALALMNCAGMPVSSLHELWQKTAGITFPEIRELAAWYQDDFELPVRVSRSRVDDLAGQFALKLHSSGASLEKIQADIVVERRFNELANAPGSNKSQALSHLAFGLLRNVWTPAETQQTLFVGDKHGGRNRYDELLAGYLDGQFIARLEEGTSMSRYRVGSTELRFQMQGEQHFAVACASIIAKYLRELTMDQLNAFWQQHRSDLKATRGYPQDAKRFRQDVEELRIQLQICEEEFWRLR